MFDGLHLGHRSIIDQARSLAGPQGRLVIVTFEPAPAAVLNPDQRQPRLMTAKARSRALLESGVDEVLTLESTPSLLRLSPVDFLEDLAGRFHPDHIIEGSDFRFGNARSGNLDVMRSEGERLGFMVHEAQEVSVVLGDGSRIPARSSAARRLLINGRVEDAALVLSRPWEIEGMVTQGHQRGREIGCPTANIDLGELVCPADGVYAGIAQLESGETFMAAISIGTNPTFEDGKSSFEVHLLDYQGVIGAYDWCLRVDLRHRLRGQVVYDTIDELVKAIDGDLHRVRSLLSV